MSQTELNFFNTTHESGTNLSLFIRKANEQNTLILNFFKANPDKIFSPEQVYAALATLETPLTSYRRAITTLTDKGLLEKTNTKIKGSYGRSNYCWKLKN
jgi:hypothetical protein